MLFRSAISGVETDFIQLFTVQVILFQNGGELFFRQFIISVFFFARSYEAGLLLDICLLYTSWKGGKGELALPAEGSIGLSPADEATLSPTAQILAQDVKELFGWNYVIKTGKPAGKDICLSPVSYTHLDVYKRQAQSVA